MLIHFLCISISIRLPFPILASIYLHTHIMHVNLQIIIGFIYCLYFQGFESVGIRDHLSKFAESLSKARTMLYPPAKKGSKLGETVVGLAEIVDKEHKRLLARKSLIEKRKEEQERQLLEMVPFKLTTIFTDKWYHLE